MSFSFSSILAVVDSLRKGTPTVLLVGLRSDKILLHRLAVCDNPSAVDIRQPLMKRLLLHSAPIH